MRNTKIIKIVVSVALLAVLGAGIVFGRMVWMRKQGPAHALSLAPQDSTGAIWIPDLHAFSQGTGDFLTHLTKQAGGSMLERLRQNLADEYGADPLDPNAFAQWGIDPQAGALLFTQHIDTPPVLVIGIKDGARLRQWLKERGSKAGYAATPQETKIGDHTLYAIGPMVDNQMTPAWHYAVVGRFILLTRASGRATLEGALHAWQASCNQSGVNSDVPAGLLANEAWQRLSKAVAPGTMILFNRDINHVSSGQPTVASAQAADGAAPPSKPTHKAMPSMFSLQLNGTGINIDGVLEGMAPVMGSEKPIPAPITIASHWDPQAVIVVFADIHTGLRMLTHAQQHSQPQHQALVGQVVGFQKVIEMLLEQAVGLNVRNDILPQVGGPLALSLRIADPVQLMRSVQSSDPATALLAALDLSYVMHVNSHEGAAKLLQQMDKMLASHKSQLTRRVEKLSDVTITTYAPKGSTDLPRAGWALWNDQLAVKVTRGDITPFMVQARSGQGGLTQALKEGVAAPFATQEGTQLFWLRGQVLSQMLNTIGQDPAMAGGMGGIISAVSQVVHTIGDIAIGVRPEGENVRWQLRETLQ